MKQKASIRPLSNGLKPAGRWMCALFLTFVFGVTDLSFANASSAEITSVSEVALGAEEGEHLSASAPIIFSIAAVPVTNSMITGWLAAGLLVGISLRFHYLMRLGRYTLFAGTVETLVLFLHSFLSEIMGKKLAPKTFWLLGSFFIFILCSNLLGLFPGIGSIGWGHETEHMFKVTLPLFRGVNADLNTTLALGALFFFFWFIWAWKSNGPVGIIKHIFAPKSDMQGLLYFVMAIVFLAVGLLEIVSIIIRPFALALRLYGNIFAGEVMLDTMLHKIPAISWLLPIPFYLMEVLTGVIQALVFTLLAAVFITMMCSHEGEDEHLEKKSDSGEQQH